MDPSRRDTVLRLLTSLRGSQHATEAGLELIETIQLSRYQRPRPQNWLQRLLRTPVHLDDTLQVQLRSARKEHARLEALCPESELVTPLPWLNRPGNRVPLNALAHTLLTLLEAYGARLDLGEPNARPKDLDLLRTLSRKQRAAVEKAQASPSEASWSAFCDAVNACSDSGLEAITPLLQRLLGAWPDALRVPPSAWIKASSLSQPQDRARRAGSAAPRDQLRVPHDRQGRRSRSRCDPHRHPHAPTQPGRKRHPRRGGSRARRVPPSVAAHPPQPPQERGGPRSRTRLVSPPRFAFSRSQ